MSGEEIVIRESCDTVCKQEEDADEDGKCENSQKDADEDWLQGGFRLEVFCVALVVHRFCCWWLSGLISDSLAIDPAGRRSAVHFGQTRIESKRMPLFVSRKRL